MKVRALHKKRVLLRHISLDSINMKRKKNGSYKMKGFGRMHFASILKKGYASDTFVYGPRMAPEIERGSQHDFRADIWSLGQMAIQLMSEVTNATDFAVAGPDHVTLCRPWKAGVPDDVK